MTTVPRCLCVPITPADFIHKMLLKMLWRVSKWRWRIAALGPNGTQGLSCSDGPTKAPGTPWRSMTCLYASGTSTILYAVDGGAVILLIVVDPDIYASCFWLCPAYLRTMERTTVKLCYCKIVTTPRPPSTRMRWPSLIRCVAVPVPTTAGNPYSRATMAAWLIEPPMSETAAEIFWNTGAQVGLVTWQTSISPWFSLAISCTERTTRAVPSTTPEEAAKPLSSLGSASP